MAGLTDLGLVTLSQEEIEANLKADLRSKVAPTIDLEPDAPNGQVVTIFARELALLWEIAQAVYASTDPNQATGQNLTALGALTGTLREDASPSTVTATCNLDPGTYNVGDLIASVDGDPSARFSNTEAVTNSGGVAAAFDVLFTCETNGPVRANAGTLTVIAEAFSGWNSVTNTLDAELGKDVEADDFTNQGIGLRLRREQDLARRGSTSVDAIRADLDNVSGVESVTVLSNDTDATDGNGLPPHSIEAVVEGGLDAEVAAAVFAAKSAGTTTYGTTTVSVDDSQGTAHDVKFSRPSDVNIYIAVVLTARAKSYVGDNVVIDTLANLYHAVGGDVVYNRLIASIMALSGLKDDPDADITSLHVGTAPFPVGTSNIVITARQLAKLDTSRITVTSTLLG